MRVQLANPTSPVLLGDVLQLVQFVEDVSVRRLLLYSDLLHIRQKTLTLGLVRIHVFDVQLSTSSFLCLSVRSVRIQRLHQFILFINEIGHLRVKRRQHGLLGRL